MLAKFKRTSVTFSDVKYEPTTEESNQDNLSGTLEAARGVQHKGQKISGTCLSSINIFI